MVRRLHDITRFAIALALTMLLAGINTRAQAVATFDFSDGVISITIPITIWGEGATPELASQWENWIESTLNTAAAEHSCFPIDINAEINASNHITPPNLLALLEAHGSTSEIANLLYNNPNINHENGRELWYVPIDPLETRRSFLIQVADYRSDGMGMVSSGASKFTVVHESLHVLGLGDKYTDIGSGSIPTVGWEGNVMSSRNLTFDNRNFRQIIEAIEREFGIEALPSCLKLQMDFVFTTSSDVAATPGNFDSAVGEAAFSAIPILSGPLISLAGRGQGRLDWSPGGRYPDTYWIGYYTETNPFNVDVSGFIDPVSGDYHIMPYLLEKICSMIKESADRCWTSATSMLLFPQYLGEFTLDSLSEIILPGNVPVGEFSSYQINYITPDGKILYEGHAIVTVTEKIK